jgi:hypothetical protein
MTGPGGGLSPPWCSVMRSRAGRGCTGQSSARCSRSSMSPAREPIGRCSSGLLPGSRMASRMGSRCQSWTASDVRCSTALAGIDRITRARHLRGGRGRPRPLDRHRQAGAAPDAVARRVGAGSGAHDMAHRAGTGDRAARAYRPGTDRISPPRRWPARPGSSLWAGDYRALPSAGRRGGDRPAVSAADRAGRADPCRCAHLGEEHDGRRSEERTYLGEVHHGHFVNPSAHAALVDPVTWQAAQRPLRSVPLDPT